MKRELLIVFVLCGLCAYAEEAYFGYRPHPHPLHYLTNTVVQARRALRAESPLPDKYDLRESGNLSPIKDQNPYGTCWAFAAMVGLEYQIRKDEGIDADLSENNLANMHGFPITFSRGGNSQMTMAVFLREEGPVTEALDPYANIGKSVRERGVRIPRKIVWVPMCSAVTNTAQRVTDLAVIKRALLKYGPLSTCYYHHSYYLKGGAYYYTGTSQANHAVSIVGWDDTYAASHFKYTPPGDGAFIIKNSWGTGYFDKGYTYISYYDTSFGRDDYQVAYVKLSDGTDYGRLYQYDPYGYVCSEGYGTNTMAYALNVFTACADERLAAFGFYALAQNTAYEAKIIVDPIMEDGVLISGTETLVATGICADAGYEVINLMANITVGAGTNFAIAVCVHTPNLNTPIPVMCNETFEDGSAYLDKVLAQDGKSYMNQDPEAYYWDDISSIGKYFCCKVYTKPTTNETTTCGLTAVPHTWLDTYSTQHTTDSADYLSTYFYGAYNALSEHVCSNGLSLAQAYAKGLDPDNATETNLLVSISFDDTGLPLIDVSPKNELFWDYTLLGSTDLLTWHPRTSTDTFFKVRVEPK